MRLTRRAHPENAAAAAEGEENSEVSMLSPINGEEDKVKRNGVKEKTASVLYIVISILPESYYWLAIVAWPESRENGGCHAASSLAMTCRQLASAKPAAAGWYKPAVAKYGWRGENLCWPRLSGEICENAARK